MPPGEPPACGPGPLGRCGRWDNRPLWEGLSRMSQTALTGKTAAQGQWPWQPPGPLHTDPGAWGESAGSGPGSQRPRSRHPALRPCHLSLRFLRSRVPAPPPCGTLLDFLHQRCLGPLAPCLVSMAEERTGWLPAAHGPWRLASSILGILHSLGTSATMATEAGQVRTSMWAGAGAHVCLVLSPGARDSTGKRGTQPVREAAGLRPVLTAARRGLACHLCRGSGPCSRPHLGTSAASWGGVKGAREGSLNLREGVALRVRECGPRSLLLVETRALSFTLGSP